MAQSNYDSWAHGPPKWGRPGPGGPAHRGLGFSEHVLVGRILSVEESLVAGHQVINCRVVVSPFHQNKPSRTTWYELSIWDSLAHAFGRQGFKAGDMALFRLENMRVEAWMDRDGQPKATIKAGVDKFLDLRPAEGPAQAPGQDGPQGLPPAAKPRAL